MALRYQAEVAYIYSGASIYPRPRSSPVARLPQRYGPTRESTGKTAIRSSRFELDPCSPRRKAIRSGTD